MTVVDLSVTGVLLVCRPRGAHDRAQDDGFVVRGVAGAIDERDGSVCGPLRQRLDELTALRLREFSPVAALKLVPARGVMTKPAA